MKSVQVHSVGELPQVAKAVIEELQGRNVVALWGEMGAGKTTLIREICDQMGVDQVVSSPTFALVNEYANQQQRPIFHFDFYRINKIEEAFDLGYEEYFFGGELCLVEWPERIEMLLPEDAMHVEIEVESGGGRLFRIDAVR